MTEAGVFEIAPKVELHLHLEGAIPLETMWEIIQGHGGDLDVTSIEGLRQRFAYRDFPHFIDTWWWMTGYLRTTDDFTHAAAAVARHLAEQNIVYAEASFSPTDFTRHGLTPQELGLAIRRGVDSVEGIHITLNCDLVRDPGPARAAETLQAVIEIADEAGVRGITIGGSEQSHPPEPFAAVYARAAEAGLHRTAHAGEAAGPQSVWGALRSLGVERIGHGVRSVEDAALVDHLVESQIPLEVCPTSNLRTGVAADWRSHPVGTLLEAGVNVTISTDDPSMFHCDLASELRSVHDHFGPELADVQRLTLAAVEASWLEREEKDALADRIRDWWSGRSD
ncbi:MAG TPA: adenosine deaminase [Acidimicrobiia bacterium]|jgi:adenosine deaminase|nr:adenosine deaminase [Acidimicrobiia bacterium]